MNILITFENKYLPIHAIDLFRTLKDKGHDLFFFALGQGFGHWEYNLTILREAVTVLSALPDLNEMDMWMYDLSSKEKIKDTETHFWDMNPTPFLELMENFKGRLVCINYEDLYNFFLYRVSDYVIDKTDIFINNALYKDLDRYDRRIRKKLVLATSYITNSQRFKHRSVPFHEKQTRSIFTGMITGFSDFDKVKDQYKCRVLVPMAILRSKLPCIYRVYGYSHALKDIFDQDVPDKYKTEILSEEDFIAEFSNSKYILSLRGMGLTVNRFFEGLASNGLVFSTKFNHLIDFIGQGIENVHYINIDWSGIGCR
jgi:hypothetical protein